MQKTNYLKLFLVRSILLSGLFSFANAQPQGVWTAVSAYSSGAANIRAQQGGEWVYKNQLQRTYQSPVAVVIGPRPRPDEVQFFSSQEEKALWDMEQKIMNDEGLTLAKMAMHRRTKSQVWPKVVVRESEICVPDFQFAASEDWKSHLVCTSKAQ